MRNLQVKTLFFWFAFLVLGFFSCYWTSESLRIWQPALGTAGSWLLAILFYVIASICFSMVLNAFNRDLDFYGKFLNRGASLFFGLIGLILFWLVCSMPTNTHTLLYHAEIRSAVAKDLKETISYLNSYVNNNTSINLINARYSNKQTEVDMIFSKMYSEMADPEAPGIGIRFKTLVVELNNALSSINPNKKDGRSIQEVKDPGHNLKQWNATFYQYKSQADNILSIYRRACDQEIDRIKESMKSENLQNLITRCDKSDYEIEHMDGVNTSIIDNAEKNLTDAYAFIKAHPNMISFWTPEDSLRYCAENSQPQVRELKVVPQVWKDYLTTDRYDGHGFAWWILLSILVDIAGFIFYYLATKQKSF